MCDIYTVQLAQHRLLFNHDIPVLNITAGSGKGFLKRLAPDYLNLVAYRSGNMTELEYEAAYIAKLDDVWSAWSGRISHLFEGGPVAFSCYCGQDKFCHRFILIEYLLAKLPHLNYCGEVVKSPVPDSPFYLRKGVIIHGKHEAARRRPFIDHRTRQV